jgi:hypothetical protein
MNITGGMLHYLDPNDTGHSREEKSTPSQHKKNRDNRADNLTGLVSQIDRN